MDSTDTTIFEKSPYLTGIENDYMSSENTTHPIKNVYLILIIVIILIIIVSITVLLYVTVPPKTHFSNIN
jgi:hypothetical protein